MAAICKQCGAPLEAGNKFCMTCGAPAEAAPAQPQAQPAQAQPQAQAYQASQPQQSYSAPQQAQPVYTASAPSGKQKKQKKQKTVYIDPNAPGPNSPYEPITTKGYIGIALLMMIPVVGIILAIVWACGGCRKINKRNFARAMLILMVIGLILSLIIGGIGGMLVKKAAEEAGISGEEAGGLVSGISGLLGITGDDKEGGKGDSGESGSGGSTGNAELDALAGLFESLEALTGEESGFGDLVNEVGDINAEAAKNADGWPKDLPDYPDGTMNSLETYRTEITGTSKESMLDYIDTLKKKGYEFQDFYEFGFTEEDMLGMDGWWGTNGKYYLSFSYYEGTVTVDHTTELPDLSGLLG